MMPKSVWQCDKNLFSEVGVVGRAGVGKGAGKMAAGEDTVAKPVPALLRFWTF